MEARFAFQRASASSLLGSRRYRSDSAEAAAKQVFSRDVQDEFASPLALPKMCKTLAGSCHFVRQWDAYAPAMLLMPRPKSFDGFCEPPSDPHARGEAEPSCPKWRGSRGAAESGRTGAGGAPASSSGNAGAQEVEEGSAIAVVGAERLG